MTTLGTGGATSPDRRRAGVGTEAADGRYLLRRSTIRRRSLVAVCGVLLAGGIAAGCGGGSGTASAPSSPAHETATQGAGGTATAPTTTTTSMPAQCGSPRDPLDPTNAPAPSPPAC